MFSRNNLKLFFELAAHVAWIAACVIVIVWCFVLVGCTPIEEPKPAPKSFVFEHFVENNLGPITRAKSPPACTSWMQFLRGVVKAESNWNKEAVYEEKFVDGSTGVRALSVGYFQLSVGDKRNYPTPYCQKLTPDSLKDPEVNTGCALEIIETLNRKGRPLGAYWSTVRDGKVKCLN